MVIRGGVRRWVLLGIVSALLWGCAAGKAARLAGNCGHAGKAVGTSSKAVKPAGAAAVGHGDDLLRHGDELAKPGDEILRHADDPNSAHLEHGSSGNHGEHALDVATEALQLVP